MGGFACFGACAAILRRSVGRLQPIADSIFGLKMFVVEAVGSGNESKRCHVFEVRIFLLFLYIELALICVVWLFRSDDMSL
jgi:hypothetical protein